MALDTVGWDISSITTKNPLHIYMVGVDALRSLTKLIV